MKFSTYMMSPLPQKVTGIAQERNTFFPELDMLKYLEAMVYGIYGDNESYHSL